MNQINYFPRATAGRLTPAIIKTIKYGGGRESISQSLTLVILASETIREQQIYSSAALSDCFPSCSSLPGSNSCPLCDTHSSAGHVVSWWQTQSCSNRLNISSFFCPGGAAQNDFLPAEGKLDENESNSHSEELSQGQLNQGSTTETQHGRGAPFISTSRRFYLSKMSA